MLDSSTTLQILPNLSSILIIETRQFLVEVHVPLVNETDVSLVTMSTASTVF